MLISEKQVAMKGVNNGNYLKSYWSHVYAASARTPCSHELVGRISYGSWRNDGAWYAI